mmetsp:Transcript_96752/g.282874  ORF Transcript_96752/g.282874 Transcript_96752/m.282874 type:complete len:130 (-) Transcript_96752:914-1303(-)
MPCTTHACQLACLANHVEDPVRHLCGSQSTGATAKMTEGHEGQPVSCAKVKEHIQHGSQYFGMPRSCLYAERQTDLGNGWRRMVLAKLTSCYPCRCRLLAKNSDPTSLRRRITAHIQELRPFPSWLRLA